MHDAVITGVQVLAILFGILFNQRSLNRFEARINASFDRLDSHFNGPDGRFDRLEGRLDRIHADLSNIFRILSQHGADIENLKRNRPS